MAVIIDGTNGINTSGNIVMTTSNGGITFNNSSAVASAQLNDYETGTWTPSFANMGTTTLNYARYVKVGGICVFWLSVVCTSAPTANSSRFTMPFAANNLGGGTWSRSTQEGGVIEPQSSSTQCYFATTASTSSGTFIITGTIQTTF